MADTTTWTPEARKIREAERAAYIKGAYARGLSYTDAHIGADREYPAPPTPHTYGRELYDQSNSSTYRRRSDGEWQVLVGDWVASSRTDESVRELAAEVPLSDAECAYLCNVGGGRHGNAAMRIALARVLRGEFNARRTE